MKATALTKQLTAENAALKTENVELKRQLNWLKEQVKLNRNQRFGSSSEKSAYDFSQIQLINEAEYFADEKTSEPKITVIKEHYRKTRLTTDKLPEDMPIETIEHTLPEREQTCPECSNPLHRIGKETVREELKIIPARTVLVKHIRYTYGCRECETHSETATIIKALVLEPVIKGSFASAESVAHIMVQKFVMGVPLYRQEKEFHRQGILLSRQTMSNWLIKATEDWLMPIYDKLRKKLLERDILHADETELQVLHEPGRTARQKSYLWVYRTGGDAKHPIVLSEYQPGRHKKHVASFLSGYKGYLHTDGYAAYHGLSEDIIIVGCWAHARRMYDQALKALPEKDRIETEALRGKRYCDKLFDIERKLAGLSADDRYQRRLELAVPILDEYYNWLSSFGSLGKSLFAAAVKYSLEQQQYLKNYLVDGRLEISNNRTERTIKLFVIDRKNFLFANTPRGAKASAVMFSIIQTAIESGLNPYEYLVYIFKNAPNWMLSRKYDDWVESLLPQSVPFVLMSPIS